MPGPGTSTTTTVNKTELPQWVNDAGKANYDKAVALDNSPLQQYAGPMVAAPSNATKSAFTYFNDHLDAGSGDTSAAASIFKRLSMLGQTDPGMLRANKLAGQLETDPYAKGTDALIGQLGNDPYAKGTDALIAQFGDPRAMNRRTMSLMDPYVDQVVNKGVGQINDQLKQSLMGNSDQATKAGAFGGSRAAIVDAVSHAQSAKDAGLLSSQLRQQGFDRASSLARSDLGTDISGRQSQSASRIGRLTDQISGRQNQSSARVSRLNTAIGADLSGAGQRATALANAGQGELSTGEQQLSAMLKKFGGLKTIGDQTDQYGQKVIDSKVGQFNERRDKELNDLNVRLSSLGMTPYNQTQTGKTTSPTPGTDYGALGLGLLSLLAGLA